MQQGRTERKKAEQSETVARRSLAGGARGPGAVGAWLEQRGPAGWARRKPGADGGRQKNKIKEKSYIYALAGAALAALLLAAKASQESDPSTVGGTITEASEAVDLGLSVKWAPWNVGATKAGESGAYFAWGEAQAGRESYEWSIYW